MSDAPEGNGKKQNKNKKNKKNTNETVSKRHPKSRSKQQQRVVCVLYTAALPKASFQEESSR
jgi:hypothetical protein